MDIKCPQCHARGALVGKIYNQVDYVNPSAHFRPDGVPLFAILTSNVALTNKFFACSFCGFLWSKIDNQKLQRFMSGKAGV